MASKKQKTISTMNVDNHMIREGLSDNYVEGEPEVVPCQFCREDAKYEWSNYPICKKCLKKLSMLHTDELLNG